MRDAAMPRPHCAAGMVPVTISFYTYFDIPRHAASFIAGLKLRSATPLAPALAQQFIWSRIARAAASRHGMQAEMYAVENTAQPLSHHTSPRIHLNARGRRPDFTHADAGWLRAIISRHVDATMPLSSTPIARQRRRMPRDDEPSMGFHIGHYIRPPASLGPRSHLLSRAHAVIDFDMRPALVAQADRCASYSRIYGEY